MAKQTVLLFVFIAVVLILPGPEALSKTIQTRQHIIVLDPGHGGPEKGLVTSSGLQEKTIVLQLALKTAQKLENRYNVRLTRNRDTGMSSRDRFFFANRNKADLFVCIHLNHSASPSGFFYYFNPPGVLAQHPVTVKNTWKSQPLMHQLDSKRVIDSFLTVFSANRKTETFFSGKAPITLLEGATMPAVLIEPLSISSLPQHPDDPAKTEALLDGTATLISKSIDLYFRKK